MNNEEFDKKVHKSHSNAYKEIERFLFKAGFDNKDEKQGSCYFTSNR